MKIAPLSAAWVLCAALALCTTPAPAQVYAPPAVRPFDHPSPPVMTAPRPRMVAGCPGEDQGFARAAEYLIDQRIDAARAEFVPAAPPLAPNLDLIGIARGRSCEMAVGQQAFSHDDAQGNFIAASRVRDHFGPYGAIGENIMEMGGSRGFGAEEFAEQAADGWMKSPGHRANILNPRYSESGIGVALVGDQAYATQVFFGPPKPHNRAP